MGEQLAKDYIVKGYTGLQPLTCGVPQDSNLGPVLFRVTVNDVNVGLKLVLSLQMMPNWE